MNIGARFRSLASFLSSPKEAAAPRKKSYGSVGLPEVVPGLPNLEFLNDLLPPHGLKKFYKMRMNDPVVSGLIRHLELVFSRTPFTFQGQNAKFVGDMLEALPGGIPGLLNDISSMFTFGFYVGELIWRAEKGVVILGDVAPRFQPTVQAIGNAKGEVEQLTDDGQYFIPLSKCFHIAIGSLARNPFGESLLRSSYKPYYYKVSLEATESSGLERDLSGLPCLKAPEGFNFSQADSSSPDYNEDVAATLDWAVSLVRNVRSDSQQGLVIPAGWEFSIIRGENRTQVPTSEIIARFNSEMASGLLEQFISLGAYASTNNSNVDLHVKNFLNTCQTYMNQIERAINKQIIEKICRFNGKRAPLLKFDKISMDDLADLAAYVRQLASQGVITPTTNLEEELLRISGLPYAPWNAKAPLEKPAKQAPEEEDESDKKKKPKTGF